MPVLATVQEVELSLRNVTCLLLSMLPTLLRRTTAAANAKSYRGFMDSLPKLMSACVVGAHVPLAIVSNA